MKFNFNKFSLKKFISVFAAIAVLMTSLPMSAFFTTVGAAGNSSIIDFEGKDASAIVEGNDAFSITGQDSEDKYYFYAKNNTADALTLTFDDIVLKNGKQYTLDFDVYTLRVSKDESDVLLGLKMYGDSETLFEKQIKNTDICEENWANYHTTFTAKDGVDKLDFSIYTIGKVFIDNLVIIDENGNETAIDTAAACEATELKDHFSMATLYDIAYEEPDIIDGYLKAAVPVNSNTIHNEGVNIPLNLDKPLDKGRYTVSVDLKFTSLGSCRDAFCASVAGVNNYDIIQQKWLNAVDITLNKYKTYTFELDLTPDHNLFRLNVYQGCTAYIDNLVLIDAAGIEVVRFDFDEPVNFEGSAFEQKGIARTQAASAALYSRLLASTRTASDDYAILVDATNVAAGSYGQLYLHEVGMPYDNTYPIGDYTIKFDYYPLVNGSSKNIVAHLTKPGWSGDAFPGTNEQKWLEVTETIGEWQTISFDITTIAEGQFPWFYIGAGMKGYFDNYQIIDKSTGETLLDFSPVEADLGKTSKDICTVVALPKDEDNDAEVSTNDVLLIDTTTVTDDGSDNRNFWFNELGMAGYGDLPNGTYTIQFDVCALKMPESKNLFHFRTSKGSGSSKAGFWKPDLTIGEWATTSSTFTVTDDTTSGNHILYVYGGFKGYVDNLVILDASGNEVAGTRTGITGLTVPASDRVDYSPYLEIVTLTSSSEEVETNYGVLVDNSAGTGYDSFWMTSLGLPVQSLPSGEKYTIEFDWYAENVGSTNNGSIRVWEGHMSGSNAIEENDSIWFDLPSETGSWTTVSKEVTASSVIGAVYIYVGAGVKGYLDNFKIIGSDGTVHVNVEFTADDLNKTINCATVVALPKDVTGDSDDSDDNDDVLSSGMNIAILRGRAGKNGASIKLGGVKSPLSISSNKTYKLTFDYYQAKPTDSGILNLFGIDTGFDNEITYFKKNNTTGWTTVNVFFEAGDITNANADWFEIILSPNAWVYFDNFKVAEQEVDNNKEVSVIDFEQKDDSIYPDLVADNCTFGQTTEFSGTSNGGNGYFCASNAREYTNDDKNSNQQYQFGGIKLKSNTTYRVSIDYYVAKPINDYAFAIGYSQKDVGSGSGDSWQIWGNNKLNVGWNTESFVFTTGEVVPNGKFLKLVIYDTPDSSNPRVMYFDNITFTELYRIDSSSNNSELGTVSSTRTVEAGSDSKVVANPYAGVTFEGWYEYGDLVSTDETYRIKDVRDNHKLVAHFSGTPVKPDRIVQGFEDYDLGDILYEYYEIVDDPNNVLEGKQSLHVKPDKIEVNADHSVFFPLVSSVEAQLKEDTEYDVYIWVKPTKPAESTTYFQIVDTTGVVDMSDLLTSPGGTGMQMGLKPVAATALEEKDGFYKYLVGTITKDVASRQGFGIQVCKFNAFRSEGASIDDLYIDMVEVVECVPDYANLKFTENLFNEISNSNFEDAVTNDNWAPLTDGVSIVDVTDKEYDWQGNKQMVFDAAASNGQEYIRVIPIAKTNKNYTFAAWTKLSAGSDITVGLYKNGNYETFENVVNGASGKLGLIDDGKWNRVSFTFNSGDSENAYLVIKGTKGTLELDMVELFIATRAYTTDPNSYGLKAPVFQMTNPIAFPDIIKTETTYIDSDDDEDDDFDDSYITSDDEDEDTDDDEKTEETKKKKKKRVVKVVKNGGTSPWVWVGVGAGALVVAAAVTIFVILFKKRKQTKKGAK